MPAFLTPGWFQGLRFYKTSPWVVFWKLKVPEETPAIPTNSDVTVYHEGSDGGQFDWIEIFTTTQKVRCYLGKK